MCFLFHSKMSVFLILIAVLFYQREVNFQLNLSRRRAQGSESNQCKFDRSGNVLKHSRESWGVLSLMVHTGIASVYYLCMSRHTFHKANMLYRSNHSIASTRERRNYYILLFGTIVTRSRCNIAYFQGSQGHGNIPIHQIYCKHRTTYVSFEFIWYILMHCNIM